MGWFWTEQKAARVVPIVPPAACPVNKSEVSSEPLPPYLGQSLSSSSSSSCPVKSPNHTLPYPASSQTSSPQQMSPNPSTSSTTFAKLNPLNYIPTGLSNTRSDDSPQSIDLPLERESSSIPKGDSDSNWEYPSPQQMYNAMLRKGYTDTPAEHVESMVAVHNWLNEESWSEICTWESIFKNGLSSGWSLCRQGEEGIARERAKQEFLKQRRSQLGIKDSGSGSDNNTQPRLIRFQGRPQEPTPKARFLTAMGYYFPESFSSEPPFDRHDWYVARKQPDGTVKEVRYVIDYYAGGVQATGEPVFFLDIRRALDTPSAAIERAMRWSGDVWYRASGGSVRQAQSPTSK